MASSSTSPVVYGPNVAQVKPMIQKPPICQPHIPGIAIVQPTSTSGESSQLCGQSLLTLGVTPGRYRYNTASVDGKQGVLMFPIGSPSEAEKSKFFVPFSKNPTTKSTVSTPTIITQSSLKKSTPYKFPIQNKVSPGTIPLILENSLKSVYRTQPQSIGSDIPTRAPIIRPVFAPSSPTSVPRTPSLVYGNIQQRFPVVLVSKSSPAAQKTTVVKFVVAKGSAPVTTVPSSAVGHATKPSTKTIGSNSIVKTVPSYVAANLTNSQAKTIVNTSLIKSVPSAPTCNVTASRAKVIVSNSIVKTEPPDFNTPVGTLLIKQSHDRSSMSALTFPSTAIASPSPIPSHITTVYPKTARTPLQTYYSSPETSSKTYGPDSSLGTPCATHTSWSAVKAVSVPEINNTDNVLTENVNTLAENVNTLTEKLNTLTENLNTLTENVNTLSEDNNEMPLKIDSVFSLCGSNFTALEDSNNPETQQGELEGTANKLSKKTICKYNEACFPVIEKLKLQGLPTIDVRKLRKLTGRQSCSQTCRENTVKRYCRLNKLCIIEKPVILDFPLLTDIKMEPEELKQFEDFLKICKPAPRSKKLVLFNKYLTKLKAPQLPTETKKKREPSDNNSEGEIIAKKMKKKKKQRILEKQNLLLKDLEDGEILVRMNNSTTTVPAKPEHVLSKKSISLLNPGGNPIPGWLSMDSNKVVRQVIPAPTPVITASRPVTAPKQVITAPSRVIKAPPATVGKTAATKVIKPLLDTKSPAFLKAVSALGSKKFFLLRVDGKNIIMPVEQNSILPRAYVLGDNTVGVSSQMYTPVTRAEPRPGPIAQSSMNTQIRVKPEPPDTGYEAPVVSITNKPSKPPTRVKQEPMGRGYADEIGPTLTNTPEGAMNSDSYTNTTLTTKKTDISIPSVSDTEEFNRPSTSQTSSLQKTTQPVSSADRIRQLKELLKQNQEDLEIIKKRRIEEAVDVSGIMDDTDM